MHVLCSEQNLENEGESEKVYVTDFEDEEDACLICVIDFEPSSGNAHCADLGASTPSGVSGDYIFNSIYNAFQISSIKF